VFILSLYVKNTEHQVQLQLTAFEALVVLTSLCVLCHRYVRGCLQSCDDADACNMTPTLQTPLVLLALCSITLMVR